jgi:hypothetical protein
MKGGTVPKIFMFCRDSPVTDEPSVLQLISGQIQWEEFDGVQWLRDGGFCQCCFSFSRTACS